MSYVSIRTEVDIDADDVLEQLSEHEVAQLFKRHMPKLGVTVGQGMGEGDKVTDRYVEEAYLAAKSLADCPAAIRDLLWNVHGRAI